MVSPRLAFVVFAVSVPGLVSCERGRAEGGRDTPTIRLSTGLPTGTFGPFNEALARGYAKLAPELRIATAFC